MLTNVTEGGGGRGRGLQLPTHPTRHCRRGASRGARGGNLPSDPQLLFQYSQLRNV